MAKQVMDIQNSHGISQGESDENQRNWSEKQWQNKLQLSDRNYDYTRRNLNFEIANGKVQKIDTSKSIDTKMREMCAARGMRWPNDPNPRRKPGDDASKVKERNVAACFIFEGSRERMHEIAFGGYGVVDLNRGADNSHVQRTPEIEQWALDTYNWVGRKFGYENIAGFYVHLDETNPHIHCDVLPVAVVKGKERVSYNKVFGESTKVGIQQKWKAFHDSYHEEVGSKWGLDRGDDLQVTGAKHRTHEQYQEELRKDIKKCETKIKSLTSMICNLSNQLEEIQNGKNATEEELSAVQEKLADKQQKLQAAKEELNEKLGAVAGLSKEISQLEDKRVSLTEGASNLIGAQLSSWGDSISRKFKGKDDKIREATREETRDKIMRDMTRISGQWKEGKTPSPEEYAQNYKYYKDQANQKSKEVNSLKEEKQRLEKENQSLQDENITARGDRWLLKELLRCPDRQLWDNLRVFTNSTGWRFAGTYAGMPFNKTVPGRIEDYNMDDALTTFNFNTADSHDTTLRVEIAGMFMAMMAAQAASSGGGGGGGNSDLPKRKDDEDWYRNKFNSIFTAAKAKIAPSGGRKR